jgi:hypothetical protein
LVIGAKDEGSQAYIRGLTVGVAFRDEGSLMARSFFQMLGLDGPVDGRGLEVDKLVNVIISQRNMEEVQLGTGSCCKEALVKRRAEFGIICR